MSEERVVPGSGPSHSAVAIVGEAPGYQEDKEGRPFVGPSGKLLREALAKAGLDADECYITNVVKVRPPNNKTPTPKEVREARSALAAELAGLPNLRAVLLVGAVPLLAVTGKTGITSARGLTKTLTKEFAALENVSVFATIHPALVLRNRNYYNGWLADIAAFSQLVYSPAVEETIIPVQTWEAVLEVAAKYKGVTKGAVDIETTISRRFVDPVVVLTAAVTADGKTSHVFVSNAHPQASPGLTPEQMCAALGKLGHVRWTMHNGMFDRMALRQYGVDLILEHDTMAMQYLLDVDERKGLEFLSSLLLKEAPYKGVNYEKIMEENLDNIILMNGRDALRTFKLFRPLADKINENPQLLRLYRWLLMPAVNALIEVSENGVPVDRGNLEQLGKFLETEQVKVDGLLQAEVSPKFNPRSTKQVCEVLYEKHGLPVLKTTDKGAPATDKDTLVQLRELVVGKPAELVDLLLEARTIESHRRFIPQWEAAIAPDGRIHPVYKPLFVVTGRLSSEQPNIQQVPRKAEYRNVFGGEEGKLWVKADYSQIELRLAAWIAREPTMLEAYRKGEDLHMLTAKLVLGDDSKEARQAAKPINFGLLYGGGWSTLQRTARRDYGVFFTEWEAKRNRTSFFSAYPALKQWHETTAASVARHKKSVSPLGRIRYLPDIDHPEETKRWAAIREGINHPVQSFASDILLSALVRLQGTPGLEPIVEVHDEIDFLVDPDYDLSHIRKIMEDRSWLRRYGIELTVPLVVELATGTHWGSLKEAK